MVLNGSNEVLQSVRGELSLQSFLEHVYGTPTILGWWPSLMEDAAECLGAQLPVAVACFESVQRKGLVELQDLYDVVLPMLGWLGMQISLHIGLKLSTCVHAHNICILYIQMIWYSVFGVTCHYLDAFGTLLLVHL